MNVQDAYTRIVFKIGTPDDTSARAINPICTNITIINELYDQLKSYANITKGIQDVFSFAQNQKITFVEAPTLALRSRGYFFGYVIVNGTRFPFDFRGPKDVFNNFRVSPIMGITNWVMPWTAGHKQYLTGYPSFSTNAHTTTLSGNINASVTTIPVASTSGFVADNGRITIGTEKIHYNYSDGTNFYGCVRGVEQTTAATHTTGDTVTENNVILLYSRLPEDITIVSNTIPAGTLAHILEPCDEHMEGIIKATVYNLLLKIDSERATAYKIDTEELYRIYEKDIKSGFARNRQNINVRDPFQSNEQGIAYGTNLIY